MSLMIFNKVNKNGEWMTSRDPCNANRGDKGSVLDRKKTLEEKGLISGVREGPGIRQSKDSPDKWWVIHWATLLEGLELAYNADHLKQNPRIQLAVSKPIRNTKIYNKNAPDDAMRFYQRYFNLVNDTQTPTTVIEIWKSTKEVESGFKRKKKAMGWSLEGLGAKVYNDKKCEYHRVCFFVSH
jgi:hypothetical protein